MGGLKNHTVTAAWEEKCTHCQNEMQENDLHEP